MYKIQHVLSTAWKCKERKRKHFWHKWNHHCHIFFPFIPSQLQIDMPIGI